MTPREFHAIAKRRHYLRGQEQQHLELLFAINTANTVNSGFARPETPAQIKDFLLQRNDALEAAARGGEPAPVTAGDAIRAMIRGLPSGFVRQG